MQNRAVNVPITFEEIVMVMITPVIESFSLFHGFRVIFETSSAISNSGVTTETVVFIVRNDADPCF